MSVQISPAIEVQGEPARVLERGMPHPASRRWRDDRIGGGHPRRAVRGVNNLYRRYAIAIDAMDRGDRAFLETFWYPDVEARPARRLLG